MHSGSFDNPEKIQYGIDLINEQQSDAIMFTGDLVNNTASEMDNWKQYFGQLSAKDGVYSVLGNHDYGDYVSWESAAAKRANLDALKGVHREMGWDLLLDEHRKISRGNDSIIIVGVENWGAGFKQVGDLQRASAGLSENEFKVLLSHDPSHWQEKVKKDNKKFHLTLSGHTHGMQFGIEIPGWFKYCPVRRKPDLSLLPEMEML